MRFYIKSTFIKKLFGQQTENNNLINAMVDPKMSDTIIPTLSIQPYIDIVKGATSSTTLYTTPTDRDFFLTLVSLTANIAAGSSGNSTITFTLPSSEAVTLTACAASDGTAGSGVSDSALSHNFGSRGILLKRGTTIASSLDSGVVGSFTIAGYTAGTT